MEAAAVHARSHHPGDERADTKTHQEREIQVENISKWTRKTDTGLCLPYADSDQPATRLCGLNGGREGFGRLYSDLQLFVRCKAKPPRESVINDRGSLPRHTCATAQFNLAGASL